MAVIGAVIVVREAGIDREVIIGIRVHQAGRDRIEALGSLTVALSDFRAEIAGPAADRIDLEQLDKAVKPELAKSILDHSSVFPEEALVKLDNAVPTMRMVAMQCSQISARRVGMPRWGTSSLLASSSASLKPQTPVPCGEALASLVCWVLLRRETTRVPECRIRACGLAVIGA
jgi:hypothetical protein